MALGPGSIALIVTAGLVIFGPKKLPDLGRSVGETLREFKKATSGMLHEEKSEEKNNYQLKRQSSSKTKHYVIKKSETDDSNK